MDQTCGPPALCGSSVLHSVDRISHAYTSPKHPCPAIIHNCTAGRMYICTNLMIVEQKLLALSEFLLPRTLAKHNTDLENLNDSTSKIFSETLFLKLFVW